jgi:hypothetical protein
MASSTRFPGRGWKAEVTQRATDQVTSARLRVEPA